MTSAVVPRRDPRVLDSGIVSLQKTLRSGNLPEFFAEQHRKLGPVAVLNPFRKRTYVISGAEVNAMVHRRGRLFLRSKEYIDEFQKRLGRKSFRGQYGRR